MVIDPNDRWLEAQLKVREKYEITKLLTKYVGT